jgi:indolepyruvate ferredoxin oxidoreductase alpha subunit
MKLTVTGDIGCYTLGALAPLASMDTCVCMGAGIGMALGIEKADPDLAGRTVAVIGDSTFFHSGMTGLLDMVYNRGKGTVIILDNATTAMTGHQDHPGTGKTAQGLQAPRADLEAVSRGLGVKRVRLVDPFDLPALEAAIREEVAADEVSVIVVRRPCVLLARPDNPPVALDVGRCGACQVCAELGCPALRWDEDHPEIDETLCAGCGLCADLCPYDALQVTGGTCA